MEIPTSHQMVITSLNNLRWLIKLVPISDKDWNYESYNHSSYYADETDDTPLNLSLKSTNETSKSTAADNVLDLIMSNKGMEKGNDCASSDNNLSNLQNLTAGIGLLPGESKGRIMNILNTPMNLSNSF